MATALNWQHPRFSRAAFYVWQRNALVWRKLMLAGLVMNLGEPLFYMLGLGFGLGTFISPMQGVPYLAFLASGIVASSTMYAASFEGMYSVYTRMEPQQTYAAILSTPLEVDDIVLGELLWCAAKATLSGCAIILVAALLGVVHHASVLWALPLIYLTGFAFAGLAMIVSAFDSGYDFFNFYFTLVLTPMLFLGGVFYPATALSPSLQILVQGLPLTHAVALLRPIMLNQPLTDASVSILILVGYALLGYYLALVLIRRRLLV